MPLLLTSWAAPSMVTASSARRSSVWPTFSVLRRGVPPARSSMTRLSAAARLMLPKLDVISARTFRLAWVDSSVSPLRSSRLPLAPVLRTALTTVRAPSVVLILSVPPLPPRSTANTPVAVRRSAVASWMNRPPLTVLKADSASMRVYSAAPAAPIPAVARSVTWAVSPSRLAPLPVSTSLIAPFWAFSSMAPSASMMLSVIDVPATRLTTPVSPAFSDVMRVPSAMPMLLLACTVTRPPAELMSAASATLAALEVNAMLPPLDVMGPALLLSTPVALSVMLPAVLVTTSLISNCLALPPAASVMSPLPLVTTPLPELSTVMWPAAVCSVMSPLPPAPAWFSAVTWRSPPTAVSWMTISPLAPVFWALTELSSVYNRLMPSAARASRWAPRSASPLMPSPVASDCVMAPLAEYSVRSASTPLLRASTWFWIVMSLTASSLMLPYTSKV